MTASERIKHDPLIQDIVKRIVDVVDPEKIIVFGSYARGTSSDDSDLDVLVVKDCAGRRSVAATIYRNLIGVGRAVDVIVARPEDLERYGASPALVLSSALREGHVVYAA